MLPEVTWSVPQATDEWHKAGRTALWLSCGACFERLASVFAGRGAKRQVFIASECGDNQHININRLLHLPGAIWCILLIFRWLQLRFLKRTNIVLCLPKIPLCWSWCVTGMRSHTSRNIRASAAAEQALRRATPSRARLRAWLLRLSSEITYKDTTVSIGTSFTLSDSLPYIMKNIGFWCQNPINSSTSTALGASSSPDLFTYPRKNFLRG